jgi:hypothetical protein
MKRLVSTVLVVILLLGLGALAALARGGGDILAPVGDAVAVAAQPQTASAPDAPTFDGPRFNHVALPLNASASIQPFNAQGLLNYIGSGAIQIANLNANSQALDFWDGSLGFGVVNDIPIFDPVEYPLHVGHPYFVQLDSSYPTDKPFSIVGDVPDIGDIQFTMVGASPCKYNEIMIPLDQYNANITNAVDLADSIGNVDIVAQLNATNQDLDFWDLGLGFGVVDGAPIFDPDLFPVKLGYPYFVCVNSSGDGAVWP